MEMLLATDANHNSVFLVFLSIFLSNLSTRE